MAEQVDHVPPRPSLWRHGDFVKLWIASTISLFGSQVSGIAIPAIAIITLNVSPFEAALLGFFEMLPFILFTLPAGVWVDRLRRRPILIAGDLGRAIALATIPIAFAAGFLTIWQLYVVGFVTGILTVFFDVADQSYLPSLLEADQLIEGNSKLQVSVSAAQIGGQGVGGAIIGLVTAPFAVIADALSFLASAVLIFLVRRPEAGPERQIDAEGSRTSMRTEIAEGLRYVLGNRYLRNIAASTGYVEPVQQPDVLDLPRLRVPHPRAVAADDRDSSAASRTSGSWVARSSPVGSRSVSASAGRSCSRPSWPGWPASSSRSRPSRRSPSRSSSSPSS